MVTPIIMANATIPNRTASPTSPAKGIFDVFCTLDGCTERTAVFVLESAAGFVPESVAVRVTV